MDISRRKDDQQREVLRLLEQQQNQRIQTALDAWQPYFNQQKKQQKPSSK